MKIKSLALAAMALTMGFASCSNDDEVINGGNETKGERTSMQFIIKAPNTTRTYGLDPNAVAYDVEFNTVKVLIYQVGATSTVLEQITPLQRSDFEPITGEDAYRLKETSKITTTTGEKRIFVALNFEGALPSVGTPLTDLAQWVHPLSGRTEFSDNDLAMFSTEGKPATLVTEDNSAYPTNNVNQEIIVKRMVAKISVQEGAALRTGGKVMSQNGELSNLQFSIGNVNATSYLVQNVVSNRVQDNNWASFLSTDFYKITDYSLGSSFYQTVDPKDATYLTVVPVYVPENTAQAYDIHGDNLTYVSIRAQYAPEFFCDATGSSLGANTEAPKSFWTVTRDNGMLYYFDDEDVADDFIETYPTAVKSDEYVKGICYFRGYLNKNGHADVNIANSTAAKYDVLRNTYYKASISSMTAPGYPTDMGDVIEATTLTLDIDILDWDFVIDDFAL